MGPYEYESLKVAMCAFTGPYGYWQVLIGAKQTGSYEALVLIDWLFKDLTVTEVFKNKK